MLKKVPVFLLIGLAVFVVIPVIAQNTPDESIFSKDKVWYQRNHNGGYDAYRVWIEGNHLFEVSPETSGKKSADGTYIISSTSCDTKLVADPDQTIYTGSCTYVFNWVRDYVAQNSYQTLAQNRYQTFATCSVVTAEKINLISTDKIGGTSQSIDYSPLKNVPPGCPVAGNEFTTFSYTQNRDTEPTAKERTQNPIANPPKDQSDDSKSSQSLKTSASVLTKEARAAGPFGFKSGMTREEIIKLVGKSHVATAALLGLDNLDDDVMVVNRAPVPNPAIETYWLTISPEDGLLKVSATGIDIETDSYGTQLRAAYRNAVASATHRYGKPDDGDPAMTDGCIQNPKNDVERMSSCVVPDGYLASLNNSAFGRFWTHLVGKNSPPDGVVGIHVMAHLAETKPFDPRIAASVFRATGLTIKSGEGYVTQEYEFAGLQEYLDAQKAAAELKREAAQPVIRHWEPWQTASQIKQIVGEEERQRQSYAKDLTKSMGGEIRWGVTGSQSEILAGIVTANRLSDQTCSQLAAGSAFWKEMFLKRFRFSAVLDKNQSLKVQLIREEGGFSVPITALPDVDRNSLEQAIHMLSIAANNGTQ